MRKLAHLFTMTLISGTTLFTGILPANANGAEKSSRPAVTASSLKEPPGYTIVSQSFTATAGMQTPSIVMCPGDEVPFGGGVYVTSTSVLVSVNTSRPLITGNGWVADVNNDSSADSGMTTYAICADKPKKYKVVQSSAVLDGPSGGPITGDAEATCPSKTVVLGGGTDSSSFDLLDNIGLSEPSPDIDYSWYGVQVSENGENPLPTMTTYAICAVQPPGYHIIWSGAVTVPDNTQGNVSVDCPGKAVPISGGGGGGPDLPMFVATLYPSGPQSWKAYVNNLTGSDDESAWAMVICAK